LTDPSTHTAGAELPDHFHARLMNCQASNVTKIRQETRELQPESGKHSRNTWISFMPAELMFRGS